MRSEEGICEVGFGRLICEFIAQPGFLYTESVSYPNTLVSGDPLIFGPSEF
jgi:hypothetical protein